ncbi:hypothetical protein ACHAXS_010346, partial [Conticribra weissflogii]
IRIIFYIHIPASIHTLCQLRQALLPSTSTSTPAAFPPPKRLATIYTYRDAPTWPKPLSRAPSICNICPTC